MVRKLNKYFDISGKKCGTAQKEDKMEEIITEENYLPLRVNIENDRTVKKSDLNQGQSNLSDVPVYKQNYFSEIENLSTAPTTLQQQIERRERVSREEHEKHALDQEPAEYKVEYNSIMIQMKNSTEDTASGNEQDDHD
jgi:hypothetical protein